MDTLGTQEQPNADVQPASSFSSLHQRKSGMLALIVMLSLAVIAGFAGGLAAPYATPLLSKWCPIFRSMTAGSSVSGTVKEKVNVVAEDESITSIVEKSSPGVVSIVISKDVPKVRSYYNNPFGGMMPFFSDPFNQGNGNGSGSGQGGSDGSTSNTEKQQIGSGSGFFVSSDGLIVTNKHVVSDMQADYTVITNDGQEHRATVLARDPNNDIAVIKVEGKDFPALPLGDSDAIKVGQSVLAIGNPLGEFANSVSRGIISGLKRSVSAGSGLRGDTEKLTGIIQIDAAINPGNSGGPLLNLQGEVIGIDVAMAQNAENIGFALPINSVKKVVEEVRTTGKISTPYLGVRYVILSEEISKQNNLPFGYGALVLRGQQITDFAVVPGSPADKAGIVENDIILEIGGQKIDEEHPLTSLISQYKVGDEIIIKLWHKGDTKDTKVTLEERK
jgi:S1-C subfamily serine protease